MAVSVNQRNPMGDISSTRLTVQGVTLIVRPGEALDPLHTAAEFGAALNAPLVKLAELHVLDCPRHKPQNKETVENPADHVVGGPRYTW